MPDDVVPEQDTSMVGDPEVLYREGLAAYVRLVIGTIEQVGTLTVFEGADLIFSRRYLIFTIESSSTIWWYVLDRIDLPKFSIDEPIDWAAVSEELRSRLSALIARSQMEAAPTPPAILSKRKRKPLPEWVMLIEQTGSFVDLGEDPVYLSLTMLGPQRSLTFQQRVRDRAERRGRLYSAQQAVEDAQTALQRATEQAAQMVAMAESTLADRRAYLHRLQQEEERPIE